MSLLKEAAYFSFSERPSRSQLCTAELSLQRFIVWRTGCCLSDSSAICSLEAPVTLPPLIVDAEYGTAKRRRHVEARLLSTDNLLNADIVLFSFWLGSVLWKNVHACVCECSSVHLPVCIEWCTWALFPDMLIAGFHLLQMSVWLSCSLSLSVLSCFKNLIQAANSWYLVWTIFTAINHMDVMFPLLLAAWSNSASKTTFRGS